MGALILSEGEIKALGRQFREATNPIERRLAFSDLLQGLTPENAQLMREQIAHLSDQSAEFREFHYAWGSVAGVDAVFNGANTPKQDMAAGLAGWAGTNPQAALAWFEGVDLATDEKFGPIVGGDEKRVASVRSTLQVGLVYGLSDDDPYAAADYVLRQGEGNSKMDWMMGIITDKVLKADGPGGASVWAEGLPEGKQRAGALSKVAASYAKEDPQSAAAWLQSMPATADKSQGLKNTFSTWAGQDFVSAGEYLGSMGASKERDWAVSGYAPRIVGEDPGAAIDWANSVSDPKLREKALIETAQVYYHRVDKKAAAQWLPESGLTEKQQQMVTGRKRH